MIDMKKLSTVCFTILLFLVLLTQAQAANLHDYYIDIPKEALKGSIIMSIGSDKAFIDGEEKSGDKPISTSGRTLVPLRFASEALGAKVDWLAKSNKVTIILNNKKIELNIGSKDMYINNKKTVLDVAAKTYNSRTYLPIRAIGEALGKFVAYNQKYNIIYLRDPNGNAIETDNNSLYWAFPNMCSLLFKGKEMVYGDSHFGIYRGNNGKLYILEAWQDRGKLLSAYANWQKTPYGNYLIYNDGMIESSEDIIYKVDGEKFQLLLATDAGSDFKFTDKYVYVLINPNNNQNTMGTNLKTINLSDFKVSYLGILGYNYGYTLGGENIVKTAWEVKSDGVYITGYARRINGVVQSEEVQKATYGKYKVSLTENSQEKLDGAK